MTDIAQLLAELDAAYAKMTPGPWFVSGPFPNASIYEGRINDYDRYDPDSGQLPPKWIAQGAYRCAKNIAEDHDMEGVVALVNAWPQLREALRSLQEEVATVRHFRELADDDIMALRERVRALEYEQQECSQVCTGLEIERDALRAERDAKCPPPKCARHEGPLILECGTCRRLETDLLKLQARGAKVHADAIDADCDRLERERDQLSEIIDTWGFAWMEEREAWQREREQEAVQREAVRSGGAP